MCTNFTTLTEPQSVFLAPGAAMTRCTSADEAFEDDDHTVMVMDMGQVTQLSAQLVPASFSYR